MSLSPEERAARIADKLQALPPTPGCYLFFDAAGKTLYVGKAKSLRSRVRSYFQEGSSDDRQFIPYLRRLAADLETVVTRSEKEAAILENELIKSHQPRFNVRLRDDKDFLCLRLDGSRAWPRLETVRRPKADGARYFGPYPSATAARKTLHLVNKHFQLRTCSDSDLASRTRPCLQYQIKRCPAPCVLDIDRAAYAQQVRAVGLFLDGRIDELTNELEQGMREASRALEFERAAIYRDQLRAVELVHEGQRIVAVSTRDQDVLGLHREGPLVEVALLRLRQGRVVETLAFSLQDTEVSDDEVLAGFLGHYYGQGAAGTRIPDEVLLPSLPEGAEGIGEWLGDLRSQGTKSPSKVALLVPQRGPRAGLLRMAADNAAHAFRQKLRTKDDLETRLEELRERLRLPSLPRRIECCDISHLGGGDTVGSVVALRDGQPDRKRYRSFTVRQKTEGDDYGAMREVLSRRFKRGRDAMSSAGEGQDGVDEAENAWDLPDLFVVDGGRGQLAVALSAARDLGLHDLALVGLAKERESASGEQLVDRVYLPGQKNGLALRATSGGMLLLVRARDEAHRFANYARTRLGKARRVRSALDDVPGLGPGTRAALLTTLGSLGAVQRASDAEILAVPGVTPRHLRALRSSLALPTPEGASEREGSEGDVLDSAGPGGLPGR